jgi:hypothetical protein
MILNKKFLIFLTALFVCNASQAQQKEFGSWNIINAKIDLADKWSAYTEFQLRSLSMYDRFYYYEIKGAVSYSFLRGYSVTPGQAFTIHLMKEKNLTTTVVKRKCACGNNLLWIKNCQL